MATLHDLPVTTPEPVDLSLYREFRDLGWEPRDFAGLSVVTDESVRLIQEASRP
jgi:hypothetical protein